MKVPPERYRYDPDGTAYSDGRRDGYAAGFAAALAMLADPTEALASAVLTQTCQAIGGCKFPACTREPMGMCVGETDQFKDILRAAASALAESAEKEDT